jgi:hypothetical protein
MCALRLSIVDVCSLGTALGDVLDDLVSSARMEPQLANKVMAHFDKSIAESLNEKVKARMNFKVAKRYSRDVFSSPTLADAFLYL